MFLIDTHAHLYWESFRDDLDQVIKRSIDAGVIVIINIGVDVNLSKLALEQVIKLEAIANLKAYSTIAIHPQEAVKYSDTESIRKDMEKLEEIYLSSPEKIVAVGECGLDYFRNNSNNGYNSHNYYNFQRKLFEAQIELAKKLNLPLVVHCRDDRLENPNHIEAWDLVLELIGNHPAVLHCYSGLMKTTKKALETPNIIVSFAGNITYPKNEYLREAVQLLPLEKIILETDSPFLAPQSKRGQRNEPSSIKEIAEAVAQIKGIPFEEVAIQTTKNAMSIFDLHIQKT